MRYNNEPYSRKIDKAWGYEMLYTPEDFPVVREKAVWRVGGTREFRPAQSLEVISPKLLREE